MADGSPSNGRRPAAYFYSSTKTAGYPSNCRRPATNFNLRNSCLVGIWLYELYLKLMNNCVRKYLDGSRASAAFERLRQSRKMTEQLMNNCVR